MYQVAFLMAATMAIGCAPAAIDNGKLDGSWIVTSGEEAGVVIKEGEYPEEYMILVIENDRLTMKWNKDRLDFTLRLDQASKPHTIDFIYPGDKGVNHGIYRLEVDELVICVSSKMRPNTSEERPIAFTANDKDNNDLYGLLVFRFKKKK